MAGADIFFSEIAQNLGWTLVHFAWQGTVIAVLLAVVLRVLRKATANVRDVISCMALVLMVVAPAATMLAMGGGSVAQIEASETSVVRRSDTDMPSSEQTVVVKKVESSEHIADLQLVGWKTQVKSGLETALPFIVTGWLVGVFGLSMWRLGGWTQVQLLKHRMVKPVGGQWQLRVEKLAGQLGVRRAVRILESALVEVPTVIGWFRPVILIPACALTGINPQQLEAILLHELAHIRRLDYLINLLQTVVETLGFYHPAVWWVSRRIRIERENCCDDMAARFLGDKVSYVRALTEMEEVRGRGLKLAVAADGGSLLQRVRRLLGGDMREKNRSVRAPAVLAVLLVLVLVIPTTIALMSGTEEKLEGLGGTVIEGIRANRDKFECGVLAWSRKAISNHSIEPKRLRMMETEGEYEMWWDGKKIATKYVHDEVYTDSTGRYWVEKRQGGNSYDGSLLSRKPRFEGPENWLGVTRWMGRWSRDWLLLEVNKLEYIRKEWSVVDVNGVKLIRFMRKNMNETATDYGAYGIEYYDPSKGYGLVNDETYNADGSLRMKRTVKLQEVIPGGWFPVEDDSKSFAITDGKVYVHQHYELDVKRCSFNDRAALPEGIFKWAIEKQLKEQEKLQKYLAMELKGLSDVKEIDKADKVKRGAREAIETFVAAALEGDFETAGKFDHPDKLPASQIKDINEMAKGQDLRIMAVVADDWSAMAVSSVIRGDHDRIGPLVFSLERVVLDGRDNWRVHDIDMETPDGAEVELKQFLEKHPEAKKVPSDTKPAVQVETPRVQKSSPPQATEDKTQIRIDFMLAESFVDAKIDWETYLAIKNLMGERVTRGDQPGFVGSVLAKCASNSGEKLEALVDLLVSRGYVKIITNPSIEVYDGQSAKIAIKGEKLSGEAENISQKSSANGTLSVIPEVQKNKETIQMYINLDLSTPEKKVKTGTRYTVLNKKYSVFPLGGMITPVEKGQSVGSVLLMVKATILDDISDIIKESAMQVEGEGVERTGNLIRGEEVEGLVLQLSFNKAVYEPGEEITFTLEARNEGTQQVLVSDNEAGFLWYLDGKLYRFLHQEGQPQSRLGGRTRMSRMATGQMRVVWSPVRLEPGQEPITMSLSLSEKFWCVSRTRDSLVMTPGDHVMQVATMPMPVSISRMTRDEMSSIPSVLSAPVSFKVKGDPSAMQTLRYGRVVFEGGSPAVVPELNIKPFVFIGAEDGGNATYMAEVKDDGSFVVALSPDVIGQINRGQLCLSAKFSEGVRRVSLSPDDPKMSVASLGKSASQPGTFIMAKPPIYYGRVLYEDGTVPQYDRDTYRTASGVSVRDTRSRPGTSELDEEGYFSLFVTDSEMKRFTSRNMSYPIYSGPPDPKTRRRIPVGQFPLELLSLDKAKAGVVKIPKLVTGD